MLLNFFLSSCLFSQVCLKTEPTVWFCGDQCAIIKYFSSSIRFQLTSLHSFWRKCSISVVTHQLAGLNCNETLISLFIWIWTVWSLPGTCRGGNQLPVEAWCITLICLLPIESLCVCVFAFLSLISPLRFGSFNPIYGFFALFSCSHVFWEKMHMNISGSLQSLFLSLLLSKY